MKSDEIIVNEVKMNPGSFAAAIKTGNQEGVLIGYEFEVCVPEKTLEKAKRPKQNIDYLGKINKAFKRTISFYDWYVKPRRGRWGLSISPRKFDSLFVVKPGVGKFKNFEEAIKALLKRNDPDEDFSDLDYAVLMYEMFGVENATVETDIEKYFDIPDPKKLYNFIYNSGMYEEVGPWGYDAEYKKSASVVASALEKTMGASVVIFNDYHERPKNFDNWYIEPDGSLEPNDNDAALEIVTPPIPAEQALTTLKSFYAMAKKLKLYTSSENQTGLHINVSIPKTIDVLKLAVFLGDQYVLKQFEREDSEYAISALKRLQDESSAKLAYSQKKDRRKKNHASPGQIYQKTSINLPMLSKLASNITSAHFSSISKEKDYVSFRHSGGDYLKDYESVIKIIGRFVQAMIIASDPEMYKKEYMTKLVKLVGAPESQSGARLQDINKVKLVLDSIKKRGLPVFEMNIMYDQPVSNENMIKEIALRMLRQHTYDVSSFFDTSNIEIISKSNTAKSELDAIWRIRKNLSKYYTVLFYPYQEIASLTDAFNQESLQHRLIFGQNVRINWDEGVASLKIKFLPFTDAITDQFYKTLLRSVTRPANVSEQMNESLQNPIYYFAYGMLTDPKYMFGADLIGVAELKNFEYKMYQFANVEPETGETVYGCLWAIDKEILSQLDKMEGYPTLYDRRTYPVYVNGEKFPAEVYVMTPNTLRSVQGTFPSKEYLKTVARGYINAGIPTEQIHAALYNAKMNEELETGGSLGLPFPGTYEQERISTVSSLPTHKIIAMTNEALDSSYPYTRSSSGKRYNFKTDAGIEYEVIFSGDRLVEISFFAGRKTERGSTKLTGTGDSRRVLGTVINIILEYADIYSPIAFHFSAENDEPSRVKLYNALTDRVEQAMPEYEKLPPADLGSGTGFMLRRKDYPEIDIQLAEIE